MPPQLEPLLASAAQDPVLAYSLAAALLLATVSLFGGLSRRDFLALSNARATMRILGLVALSFVMAAASEYLVPAGLAWGAWLAALSRLPIYLAALAYGPTIGLLAGILHAAFASTTPLPGLPELVLALELTVLGWLAIYPSPRSGRMAGPVNALLAYLLAWGTGGIALAAANGETIGIGSLLAQHGPHLPGLLLVCALLGSIGPTAYAKAFPSSRIDPKAAAPARGRQRFGSTGATDLRRTGDALDRPAFVTHRGVLERDQRGTRALALPETPLVRVRPQRQRSLSPAVLPEDEFNR